MKKKDIYISRLRITCACLLTFCLWNVFPKWSIVPPSVGLGLFPFVFVFFSFDFEHHCIGFFFLLKIFGSFGFFFMPPSFVWTLLMIENFLLCPPVLFGHFQSLRFFFLCLLHLPPVWCVILAIAISKKCY